MDVDAVTLERLRFDSVSGVSVDGIRIWAGSILKGCARKPCSHFFPTRDVMRPLNARVKPISWWDVEGTIKAAR
jgi:hypothetical protein